MKSYSVIPWLGKNLSALLLAFFLSLVVWISAVVTADPNEEHVMRAIAIEKVGQASDLLLVGDAPNQARLTIQAPKSIWDKLNKDTNLVKAWVDLSGYGPGTHTVEVKTQVDISPIRIEAVDPQRIQITLENLATKELKLDLQVSGVLPVGYRKEAPVIEPESIRISGAESLVEKVTRVRAVIDISGALTSIERTVPVEALDANGDKVENVTVLPKNVKVIQPINLQGGFKNVVVKISTTGQVANGYRLTNISVSPPTVTLFSDTPQVLNEMPGFVETLPVDLTNISDDLEISVGLDLPQGISLVQDSRVLVQVSVAAIEGSMTFSVPVQVTGLPPELSAEVSPATVDIIVAGPLNILETLAPDSFLVVLDLADLPVGVYQRPPIVDQYPDQVRIQTVLPETVEVTILIAPTPTPISTSTMQP